MKKLKPVSSTTSSIRVSWDWHITSPEYHSLTTDIRMALCAAEANFKYREGDDSPIDDQTYDFFRKHASHLFSDAIGTDSGFSLHPKHITGGSMDIKTLPARKYRAWDISYKEMLEDVLIVGPKLLTPESSPDTAIDARIAGKWYREFDISDGFLVMSTTGRFLNTNKEATGVIEIYCGDVIEWTICGVTHIGVVHFSNMYNAFLAGHTALGSILKHSTLDAVKLLGNICQQPELLKRNLESTDISDVSALRPCDIERQHWYL